MHTLILLTFAHILTLPLYIQPNNRIQIKTLFAGLFASLL